MKAITTKYIGPTDHKGSRISASDSDGNRVIVPYRSEWDSEDNHGHAALSLCRKMGWAGTLVCGHIKGGMVFVFTQGAARIVAR